MRRQSTSMSQSPTPTCAEQDKRDTAGPQRRLKNKSRSSRSTPPKRTFAANSVRHGRNMIDSGIALFCDGQHSAPIRTRLLSP